MSFVSPSPVPSQSVPPGPTVDNLPTYFDTQHPVLTLEILRRTGLGLKLRVFFALSCIALVPSIPLALILLGGEKTAALLSGRNALLCAIAIFVAIVLVATWVAQPVIRPIRRATRQIEVTTESITHLAQETLTIADEQSMGITIISGASAKLFGRRQSIIRDCRLIERSCHGLQFRVQTLQTLSQTQPHQPYIQAMLQEITNIAKLANTIATSLENDNSLENLKHAMTSASDFSLHFKKASSHLQQEAAQIERAAQSLL